MTAQEYLLLYRDNLLNDVIPFWLKHSKDSENGGYFTCLGETGNVYDTDKFIWLQCRQVWGFAMLYNRLEQKQEWLDFAIHGANFLIKHGRDAQRGWYFSLNRQGLPLTQAFNIFSDCFAAMAFGQLFLATNKDEYAEIAKDTFYNILRRQKDPKGKYSKIFPGTRPMQSFSLPMILSNLVLEIENLLESSLVEETIFNAVHAVMELFYDEHSGLIMENVTLDGKFSDSFEGRLINPGHGEEAMWFMMNIGERTGNRELIKKAAAISLNILKHSWDAEHGGLYNFLDVKGYPPQQLEWNQKLWWVHIETTITMLKGYQLTGDKRCWEQFEKLHEYNWTHFVDRKNGEWYGYLSREGKILLPLKGGKWKGFFHVPRGLFQCWKTLESIEKN